MPQPREVLNSEALVTPDNVPLAPLQTRVPGNQKKMWIKGSVRGRRVRRLLCGIWRASGTFLQ